MVNESILKKEMETFAKKKPKLLEESAGKFVLIKGDTILGVYDSQNDAIKIGISNFGNAAFLVKKIEAIEQTQNFASNLIIIKKL